MTDSIPEPHPTSPPVAYPGAGVPYPGTPSGYPSAEGPAPVGPAPYVGAGVVYPGAVAAGGPGIGLGIAAVVFGAIPLLLSLIMPFAYQQFIYALGYQAYSIIATAHSIIAGAAGVVAVVLGIIAIIKRGRGAVWGGIGLGLGSAAVIGTLGGLLLSAAYGF